MDIEFEKISFDELMREYTITNMTSFKVYLKEVWRVRKIFLLIKSF